MASPPRDDSERRAIHQQNRESWNAITPVHNSHKRDQAKFLRDGGSTLFADVIELLGDLHGKRVAHLQCNCGQDTLSLARLGAEVCGIDIGDDPIAFARQLSEDTGIPAEFHRSDLFDWFESTEARFDIAFTSYGGIGWLCDLDRWALGVARVLCPGGRLVLIEFHPISWSFGSGAKLLQPYFLDGPIHESEGVRDYVSTGLAPSGFEAGNTEFTNPARAINFQWTVAQIVQSLIDAGLRIESLREYPYANGCAIHEWLQPVPGRRFAMPDGQPAMPLMVSITGQRG